MSITFEVPNLDDASVDPADLDNIATVLRLLADYAEIKANAMRYRLEGDILTAVRLERSCQRLYGKLPEWARW